MLVNTHEFVVVTEILHIVDYNDKIANVNIPFNKNIKFGKKYIYVGKYDVYLCLGEAFVGNIQSSFRCLSMEL